MTYLPTSMSQPAGRDAQLGYLPIAEHGVIGDLRSVALVGSEGTIDWYCCPRFDAPSVFGAILDRELGGHYRIAPVGECSTRQMYLPDTNVLITRFLSPAGVAELQDFMPIPTGSERQRLIRRVSCVRGEMRFQLECEPRFNYGRDEHETLINGNEALFHSPSLTLVLSGPLPLARTGSGATVEFVLAAGETATFVLQEPAGEDSPHGLSEADAQALLDETAEFWLDWIGQSSYKGRWREMVNRSALALKLLSYAPTGAIVAAATTSLPEQLGGGRNWDYRYTFVRDAAFALQALLGLGFKEEAAAYAGFMSDRFHEASPNPEGPLRVMYSLDGQGDLSEQVLEHLEGYDGSAPVRIGNEAAFQLQLDIYGEIIDAAYVMEQSGGEMPYDGWRDFAAIVEWLCANWDQPDEGIWETRGGRQRFTHSRLMSWVALDRAVRIARDRAFPADIVRWMGVRDEIFGWIMERAWNEERQAFVQHDQTDVLDASVLMMPLVGFISPRTRAGSRPWMRSRPSSSPTASSTATTRPPPRTGSKATRAPSRSAASGTPKRSRARAGPTRPGSRSRRCSPTPTTSASTPRRSGRAASCSATSRRRSRTSR